MKKHIKLFSLLLCFAMVLGLFGCAAEPEVTVPPTTEAPVVTEPPAEEIYADAVAVLENSENLDLSVIIEETRTVGSETYTFSTIQALFFQGLGSDAVKVSAESSTKTDDTYYETSQFYADGTAYAILDGYAWQTAMDQETYLSRFVPAVLLDAGLYATVTNSKNNDGDTVFSFSDASAAESWALPENAQFLSGSGEAYLDTEGRLTYYKYWLSYTIGPAQVDMSYSVGVEIPESQTLPGPREVSGGYTALEVFDAPMLLYRAAMDLYQANALTCKNTESVVSLAAELIYSCQMQYDTYGADSELMANVQLSEIIQDLTGSSETYTQTESYRDGIYTYAAGTDDPVTQELEHAQFQEYCNQGIVYEIWDPSYLTAATVKDLGSAYMLTLTGNDELADAYCKYISTFLFEDENFLYDNSESLATTQVTGYLSVDKYTGLPTAFGYAYVGSHTVDGEEYSLSCSMDQAFVPGSSTAYETITGEPLPDAQPETNATPLFYHVTGEDGEEMWLIGTIHIGDERTAYLPQEIYDALDASDALAVEFDINAFEEELLTNSKLAAKVTAAYVYEDGSATVQHLDEELYETALNYMVISGNFNPSVLLMKPQLYTQSIENFYLQQGSPLVSAKGVDNRLLAYAREHEIEILDVESGLFQAEMLFGFSDELQEYLLEEALNYTSLQYCTEAQEMYELWCQGDEAALREYLIEDTSDMTEAELALYGEYNNAMIIERNTGMLNVALDYLDSGDTVFYAVGLAHLLQENGLVDALRDAGYAVELVSFEK